MTAYSSQGQTFEIAKESSAGVPGTYSNVRLNEEATGPKTDKELAENNVVKYDPADTEKPITHELYKEGALQFSADLRGGSDAATEPLAASALASAGCDVAVEAADTTVATYTDTESWTLTDDYADVGQVGIIELDSGVYWPVLVATDTSGAITPSFGLPSAASAGNAWARIHSVTPRYRQTPTDATLAFRHTYRAAQVTNQTQHVYTHCALTDALSLEVNNAQPVTVSYSFCVSKRQTNDAAIAVESFGDSADKVFIGGANFECAFADASNTTITNQTSNKLAIETVVVDLNAKAVPVIGIGGEDVNGCDGYVMAYEPGMVTITALYDKDQFADINDELLQSKYMHLIQGNTTGKAVFGLFVPRMHPAPGEDPIVTDTGSGYWKTTQKYQMDVPSYSGETGLDDNGSKPWYLAIGVAP